MKRITAIITAILIVSGMITISSAHAGSAKHHTLEGVMIGAGVTLLGAAILHEIHKDSTVVSYHYTHGRPHHPAYRPHRHGRYDHYHRHGKHYKHHKHHRHDRYDRHHRHDRYDKHRTHHKSKHDHRYAHGPRGHWQKEKIWVRPVYEKRWNPGHYNRRGVWVSGRYEKIMVREGHWEKKKVWVRH